MTPKQAKTLKTAIARLMAAEVESSWAGSQPVEEHEQIEKRLKRAHKRVFTLIEEYTEKPNVL